MIEALSALIDQVMSLEQQIRDLDRLPQAAASRQ